MLRTAWIRPTFAFALAALLATLAAAAIDDFSVVDQETRSANLLLCAYLLTATLGVALLLTVARTIHVLRPTGVVAYRFQANDRERREKVAKFVSKALNEYPTLGPIERLLLPIRPVGLTATERLFAEVDDALESNQAARFSGALQRLRDLIERSANDIAKSELGFQPPGRPSLGYWFPLDALVGRLSELWRSALTRQGYEFEREMWSLEHWLLTRGMHRRSGELLEVALQSGLYGYQVAKAVGQANGHARHEWINLGPSAWWQVHRLDGIETVPESERFVRRLIEYLQEYGNMLLRDGDAEAFRNMLAQFRQAFYDSAEDRWMYRMPIADRNAPLTTFEYAVLALLALSGRIITLKEQGKLADISQFLDPIDQMVAEFAPIERYVPAAYDGETPLYQQWSWWDMGGADEEGVAFAWVAPEQYPMLILLLRLLRSGSDTALPGLGGYAQGFIEAWTSHRDVIVELAGVAEDEKEETIERFERRLETAKAAEEHEIEELHIAAPLDEGRVSRFLANLRMWRGNDRALQACFQDADRVRLLDADEWPEDGRFGHSWLLPRSLFTDNVVSSTAYAEFSDPEIVFGFELGLARMLMQELEGSSTTQDIPSTESEHVARAVELASTQVGAGQLLIVYFGDWPPELRWSLSGRVLDSTVREIVPDMLQYRLVVRAFSDRTVLWVPTNDEPVIAVVNPDRWGWLVRAPIVYADFAVGLQGIDQEAAEQRAVEELPGDDEVAARLDRTRSLRLLVRVTAEERSRFEIEDLDAARIIRVASSSSDDDDESEA
ncbi:MAG: hypothetical protein OXN87_10260 [Chloroflexota bacterium]|nr:hypothetical protein [Chloroflexota bacterium]